MRSAFVHAITEAAASDDRVFLLVGDLGYKIFDDFARRFPGRYLNAGVAEANMTSMAAGLALEGLRPFTYSIVPFAVMRCLEQIRNDICQMRLPVTVVGVGAGYAYGINGPTHHGVDDVGAMRSLAGMTVVSPCDPAEVALAVPAIISAGVPAYLRLGRNGEPILPAPEAPFILGTPRVLRDGRHVAILVTGSVASEALTASDEFPQKGFTPLVLSMHTLKPIKMLSEILAARDVRHVVTVEEHGPHGGLYEAVCGALAGGTQRVSVRALCAPDRYVHEVNDQEGMRVKLGLDAASIARAVHEISEIRS